MRIWNTLVITGAHGWGNNTFTNQICRLLGFYAEENTKSKTIFSEFNSVLFLKRFEKIQRMVHYQWIRCWGKMGTSSRNAKVLQNTKAMEWWSKQELLLRAEKRWMHSFQNSTWNNLTTLLLNFSFGFFISPFSMLAWLLQHAMGKESIFPYQMEASENIKCCLCDYYYQSGGYFKYSTLCKYLILVSPLPDCVKWDEITKMHSSYTHVFIEDK